MGQYAFSPDRPGVHLFEHASDALHVDRGRFRGGHAVRKVPFFNSFADNGAASA
jgi:hypothetical protein